MIDAEEAAGARLVTVLDSQYPVNLRAIYDRPPFLFIRGELSVSDETAIAIVGTRQASDEGLAQASELAKGLAEQNVTVLSGMALGIDTAAHGASLEAGGRTVAVMGTGIRKRYPKQSVDLADEIKAHGALISQFWPDSPPRGPNFLIRNVVTSVSLLVRSLLRHPARVGPRATHVMHSSTANCSSSCGLWLRARNGPETMRRIEVPS